MEALVGALGLHLEALGGEHILAQVLDGEPCDGVLVLLAGRGARERHDAEDVYKRQVITVTAKPDEGYVLAYVTVDGQRISGSSFTMPGHAVTVSAVFVRAGLPFTDVAYGDWFYDEVAYVYANGLMEGCLLYTSRCV